MPATGTKMSIKGRRNISRGMIAYFKKKRARQRKALRKANGPGANHELEQQLSSAAMAPDESMLQVRRLRAIARELLDIADSLEGA
jgi:hypothetical protein